MNLVTINLDGTDKKYLTDYDDGTWFQNPDWSPDGTQIVFSMFRNYQQNIYTINADSSDLKALTWDPRKARRPMGARREDLLLGRARRDLQHLQHRPRDRRGQADHKRDWRGVHAEQRSGHLLYTSFGWKTYGLPAEEFMSADAGHLFRTGAEQDQELISESVACRGRRTERDDEQVPSASFADGPSAVRFFGSQPVDDQLPAAVWRSGLGPGLRAGPRGDAGRACGRRCQRGCLLHLERLVPGSTWERASGRASSMVAARSTRTRTRPPPTTSRSTTSRTTSSSCMHLPR